MSEQEKESLNPQKRNKNAKEGEGGVGAKEEEIKPLKPSYSCDASVVSFSVHVMVVRRMCCSGLQWVAVGCSGLQWAYGGDEGGVCVGCVEEDMQEKVIHLTRVWHDAFIVCVAWRIHCVCAMHS